MIPVKRLSWSFCSVFLILGMAAAPFLLLPQPSQAATYTVTNTNDSGPGSLRQAIIDANGNPGEDTIDFNIPGPGVQTISPLMAFPQITDPVSISGLTQPGYAGTPLIEIEGSNLGGSGASCFHLTSGASGSRILGLAINRFTGAEASAVRMFDSDNNEVSQCHLGTDPDGTIGRGNGYGVFLEEGCSFNTIASNLISGNEADGIHIKNQSNGNLIYFNLIGTDADGAADLGNGGQGVDISWGCADNRVGLVLDGEPSPNLISGNDMEGVLILEADSNSVQCNLIGTDFSGDYLIPNEGNGVYLYRSGGNIIGGDIQQGEGNLISGNGGHSIAISEASTGNRVLGNFIGTDLSGGGGGMANGASGVQVANGSHGNLIGDSPLPRTSTSYPATSSTG